jgi:hypothetical protein
VKEIQYPFYRRIVGLRVGLEGSGKFHLHWVSIPGPSIPAIYVSKTLIIIE